MHIVTRTIAVVCTAVVLDLWSLVTISALQDFQEMPKVVRIQGPPISDCSLLADRQPKPRVNIFDTSADVNLGEQTFSLIHNGTAQHPEAVALLQEIYTTIEPHLPAHARTWTYRFYVGASPTINAYSLGGGIIIVNEGVFVESPSVEFIAHIVAHEIGHAALRHLTHRQSVESLLLSELSVLARAIADPPENVKPEEVKLIFRNRLEEYLGYPALSYELEMEADVFAADVMARAGYDLATVALHYQERAVQEKEGRGAYDGSTHPPNRLRELILRCTDARPIARPYLDTALARVRGALVTRSTLERTNALQ